LSFKAHRRYIQIAFNGSVRQVRKVLPQIPYDTRIIIEAGTPFIKSEGMRGVHLIRRMWKGLVVADMKVTDGAINEVSFAVAAGANAVTVMGSAPVETVNLFCEYCTKHGLYSMIDMLGVDNPLQRLMALRHKPNAVVIHKGRDEESDRRQIIRYKDISKIRSKFDCLISVAGGLVVERVRDAFFNGADIAILNVVSSNDPNEGISENADIEKLISAALIEVGG